MDISEFLSKVSFKSDNWDDYGYRQTAEIRIKKKKQFLNL